MNALKKPLRIPTEFSRYAEEKGIFELYERMMRELLVEKPADPLAFLHEFLGHIKDDVSRVVIYGPPASGQHTLSKLAARKLKAVHISLHDILADDQTSDGDEVRTRKRSGMEIPDRLWAKLLKNRFKDSDCRSKGWVLEGFPRTRLQALALQVEGIMATHFVHLTLPDAVLIERYSGKRIDCITGAVYHVIFVPPKSTDVAQRLEEEPGGIEENVLKPLKLYHRLSSALLSCYLDVSKTFNADQPIGDIFAQVYSFLCTVKRTCAPRIPRVLLLGPTGSGKSLLAAQLARAYHLVEVDYGVLIKQALTSGSKVAIAMKPFHDKGLLIPDDMVVSVLCRRLNRLDCMTRGYVLHGFPLSRNQAQLLDDKGHQPNRVFFLNISEESIEERLTLRRIDPETGEKYHLLFKPPPSKEVKDRLLIVEQSSVLDSDTEEIQLSVRTLLPLTVEYAHHNKDAMLSLDARHCTLTLQHPRFTKEKVLERTDMYNKYVENLMDYYDWGQHVNADQDPLTVFECLEGSIINSLPKQPGLYPV